MNAPIKSRVINPAQQKISAAFQWLQKTDFGSDEANLHALTMATEIVALNTKRAIPQLNEGEIYAGAIVMPNGEGHHVILLPGDHDDSTWHDSMEWAKSIGGDLPDRVEQALFYKHLPDHFQKDWYWSNTQHAAYSYCAWCQHFRLGYQSYFLKDRKCRARAVRRVAI